VIDDALPGRSLNGVEARLGFRCDGHRVTAPLALYASALRRAGPMDLLDVAGRQVGRLDTADWTGGLRPGDRSMLDRCVGATLDVGCGPGRLAAALHCTGRTTLGVDVCPEAVRQARRRGAPAVRGNVFAPMPGEGSWSSILLADGNLGIGGDPHRLLRRCATLVHRNGTIVAELHPPGARTWSGSVLLRHGGQLSRPFPLAAVAASDAAGLADRAGLRLRTLWTEAGRWFAQLLA
jgi:SAM-dependent methyltransferase